MLNKHASKNNTDRDINDTFTDCVGKKVSYSIINKYAILKLLCCALFCLTFLVHMLCGSCTGRKCCFACGANVLIVTNLIRNGFGVLEINFVCLTSDSLTTDQYFVETFTCYLFTICCGIKQMPIRHESDCVDWSAYTCALSQYITYTQS